MIPAMNDPNKTSLSKALVKLEKLYEIGDYKQAKALAVELIKDHDPSPEDRKRIDAVLSATRTDPGAIVAFLVTFALMLYLYIKYGM